MAKATGLYLLSFSSYWENSHTHGLFGWDTYCSASSMELLSTSVVKVFHWKVALGTGTAWRHKSGRRVLQKSEHIFDIFFLNPKIFPQFFENWRGLPLPLFRSCRPLLDLSLDPRVCHAKFGCSSSYRDWMHCKKNRRIINPSTLGKSF